ncbi:MAG: ATP-binding protein [Clostridia bacterium]|nr:ATP-binding protein [Clostridia bacterium]
MPTLWLLSGPCGAGKTTLSARLAAHLSHQQGGRQVCLLHGDDFYRALMGDERSPAALPWPEVLRFNWDCLLSAAGHALQRGLDVVMDYIVEDELPRVCALARQHGASLRYAVLTAGEDALRQRLAARGDAHLTERALLLREKLLAMPENQGRIIGNDAPDGDEALRRLLALPELLHCDIDTTASHGVS